LVGQGLPFSEIPWSKITDLHLCCAAAGANGALAENSLAPTSFAEVRSLARQAGVSVVLSITDSSVQPNYFPANTAPAMVDTFVNSIKAYVTNNGFDGVDLDWESSIDVNQYTDLISRLRVAMPEKITILLPSTGGRLPTTKS
jgi:GH18 family chitinase